MKLELSYFDIETTKAPPTLAERCLYVLIRVACCWALIASALLFFTLDRGGAPIYAKLHFIAGAALAIAAGIFSVVLPLSYVLRAPRDK